MRLRHFCFAAIGLILLAGILIAQPTLRPAIQTIGAGVPAVSATSPMADLQVRTEKKSVWLALGYSLIVPGLGHLYADDFPSGRYYMGADVALWMTYGGLRTYGRWLKQDAQTFASQHAGANFDGKGDQFAVDLGNFANVYDYNDAKLRNRQFDLLYDPNSNFAWQWSSDDDRFRYKNQRIRGDAVIRNSQFAIGALVLNRIISAISAARAVSAYNRSVQALGSWRLKANVKGGVLTARNVELTLTREF
jgi:hypothetical protein